MKLYESIKQLLIKIGLGAGSDDPSTCSEIEVNSVSIPVSSTKELYDPYTSSYIEIFHHLCMDPSLYPVLRCCILSMLQAKEGYRTEGQDTWMNAAITGD